MALALFPSKSTGNTGGLPRFDDCSDLNRRDFPGGCNPFVDENALIAEPGEVYRKSPDCFYC